MNPLQPFIDQHGAFILDGGLATQLEARGFDLNDTLWSAKLLQEAPEVIQQVHADYLWAGADCVITASYQATLAGFQARGATEAEAIQLLQRSVRLAQAARDAFWAVAPAGRLRPFVAASIGPYGAYLANGAEYTGDYDLDENGLVDFHRRRWQLLAACQPDLLACETIPSLPEARAFMRLLAETPKLGAWFSFSCQNGRLISDGTPIATCAKLLDKVAQVHALGINCTAPRHIPSLIQEVRRVTQKPIVVYPNSGEEYDPVNKVWLGESVPAEFGTYSREWRKLGAAAIGGCCRTTPAHIRQIRDRFWHRGVAD
ncbi:MAG: homocysteine S-methyltransferase [Chloroflexota bacterium]